MGQPELKINKVIIENLLNNVDQEQAIWKPDADRWSLFEILNHLIDIEIEDFRNNLK